jgi:hypothetical protein
MSFSHRGTYRRLFKGGTAVLALAFCVAVTTHSAFGQTTEPPVPGEPLHTVIPVHLDPATGDIKVGRTTYYGTNPGLHLLALKRQPDADPALWDTAVVIQDQVFTDPTSANAFLQSVLANTKDAFLIANGVGNYGVAVNAIAKNLELFGGQIDLEAIGGAIPFIFIGNGGLNKGNARQRGYSTVPIDGYLALDASGKNYTFIQTDYVRYDITPDGTITIGGTAYTAADSFRNGGCDVSNSFRLVIVDRETLKPSANNSYCTAGSDQNNQIGWFIGDLSGVVSNESLLVFIGTNGHPIPADWNFGTDGDGRFYPLAQEIAKLGGYFETIVYLTPNDTYSLVGAAAPPSYVSRPRSRARESSTVYPGQPTGELHGVLARGRGNWYSPLNADFSGTANLDLYDKVLAQVPVQPGNTPEATFPQYAAGSDQASAFTIITTQICQAENVPDCTNFNPRSNYHDTDISIGSYLTDLGDIKGPGGVDCSQPANGGLPFCEVWQQLSAEFHYVVDIRKLATNLSTLGTISGVNSLYDLIDTWQTVQGTMPTPAQASAPSLVSPIVNLVLGLASAAPTPLAPLFGIADTFFNFGGSLTTDQNGNQQASLALPVANLANQAQATFIAQLSTIGTQFDLIYQNWQMMKPLGQFLGSGQPAWAWDASTPGQISLAMEPAVKLSMYRNLMSAVYAIGAYVPNTSFNCYGNGPNPVWGQTPLWQQPRSYVVLDTNYNCGNAGNTPAVQPFAPPSAAVYIPYTYPTDSANPFANDPHSATLLADGSWLAISLQTSPYDSGPNAHYDPPNPQLLSTLFTPVGQTSPEGQPGLGLYRPALFEDWPLPRVTCGLSFGDYNGYSYTGGCNWSAAAAPLEAVPEPVARVSIAAAPVSRQGTRLIVELTIHNSGTKDITSAAIRKIALRTLQGAHDATIVAPALPIQIGTLAPGKMTTIFLTVDAPRSVNKLLLAEIGTAQTGESSPYKFSLGQVISPKRVLLPSEREQHFMGGHDRPGGRDFLARHTLSDSRSSGPGSRRHGHGGRSLPNRLEHEHSAGIR